MKVTCIVSVSKQLLYSVDLQYDFWSHQIYERETKKKQGHPRSSPNRLKLRPRPSEQRVDFLGWAHKAVHPGDARNETR